MICCLHFILKLLNLPHQISNYLFNFLIQLIINLNFILMKLTFKHQDSYSRGQLLLRTFFGFLYIIIPHYFLLMFIMFWGGILSFISWWAVLFTAKYPKGMFNYQVNMRKWTIRVSARLYNMADGYPSFGLKGTDGNTNIEVPYPATLSRGLLLLRFFFGFIYVYIPHGFCLFFRGIATCFLSFLAWWAILFTGKYPKSWFDFNVGTIRWLMRVDLYMSWMDDKYPKFSGKEFEEELTNLAPTQM